MRPLVWFALTCAAFVGLLTVESAAAMMQLAAATFLCGVIWMRSLVTWVMEADEWHE